jgi:hypothetical protein
MTRQPGTLTDAEQIVGAAVAAFGQGARSLAVAPPAIEILRRQFIPQISSALRSPGWREDWQRERLYVLAYAEALGRRAQVMAADDRRTVIMPQDIDAAATRLRGYMPIAGRWCAT